MKLTGNESSSSVKALVAVAATLSLRTTAQEVYQNNITPRCYSEAKDEKSKETSSSKKCQDNEHTIQGLKPTRREDLLSVANENKWNEFTALRNATTNTAVESTPEMLEIVQIDLGVLDGSRKSTPKSTTCRIGLKGGELLEASKYLSENRHESIDFDASTNTVICSREDDNYGCFSMHMQGCAKVHCNSFQSCVGATIEDANTIVCDGKEACLDATLDASDLVDCGGASSCEGANIGWNSKVSKLDCHGDDSACAFARTFSVGEVLCTASRACYRAQLMGVQSKVVCEGNVWSDEEGLSVTCGGENALIRAAKGHSIDVFCNGDFSCAGYGLEEEGDEYVFEKGHTSYLFDVDVGRTGTLTCGGYSFAGEVDDYHHVVCSHLKLRQGCNHWRCQSHEDVDICEHIFSSEYDEWCVENPSDYCDDNDDPEDCEFGGYEYEHEYICVLTKPAGMESM